MLNETFSVSFKHHVVLDKGHVGQMYINLGQKLDQMYILDKSLDNLEQLNILEKLTFRTKNKLVILDKSLPFNEVSAFRKSAGLKTKSLFSLLKSELSEVLRYKVELYF